MLVFEAATKPAPDLLKALQREVRRSVLAAQLEWLSSTDQELHDQNETMRHSNSAIYKRRERCKAAQKTSPKVRALYLANRSAARLCRGYYIFSENHRQPIPSWATATRIPKIARQSKEIECRYVSLSSLLSVSEQELRDARKQLQTVESERAELISSLEDRKKLVAELEKHVIGEEAQTKGQEKQSTEQSRKYVARLHQVEAELEQAREESAEHERTVKRMDDDLAIATEERSIAAKHNDRLRAQNEELARSVEAERADSAKTQDLFSEYKLLMDGLRGNIQDIIEASKVVEERHRKDIEDLRSHAAQDLANAEAQAKKQIAAIKTQAADDVANALASTQCSCASVSTFGLDFFRPVRFSGSRKDLRIQVGEYNGEARVDIREWYGGVRSKKV